MAASILQSSLCARCRSQCDASFLILCGGSYFHPCFTHEETGTAEKWPLRSLPDHTASQGPVRSALCPPLQNAPFLAPEFRTLSPTAAITHTSPSGPRAFAQAVLRALPVAGSSHILQVSVEMSLLQRGFPNHTTPKSRPILLFPHPIHPVQPYWAGNAPGLLLTTCPVKEAPPAIPATRFQMRLWRTFHAIAQKAAAKYSIVRMCQNLVNESLND